MTRHALLLSMQYEGTFTAPVWQDIKSPLADFPLHRTQKCRLYLRSSSSGCKTVCLCRLWCITQLHTPHWPMRVSRPRTTNQSAGPKQYRPADNYDLPTITYVDDCCVSDAKRASAATASCKVPLRITPEWSSIVNYALKEADLISSEFLIWKYKWSLLPTSNKWLSTIWTWGLDVRIKSGNTEALQHCEKTSQDLLSPNYQLAEAHLASNQWTCG